MLDQQQSNQHHKASQLYHFKHPHGAERPQRHTKKVEDYSILQAGLKSSVFLVCCLSCSILIVFNFRGKQHAKFWQENIDRLLLCNHGKNYTDIKTTII